MPQSTHIFLVLKMKLKFLLEGYAVGFVVKGEVRVGGTILFSGLETPHSHLSPIICGLDVAKSKVEILGPCETLL